MSIVGQKEKATQERVIQLFQSQLGYTYLGNWHNRANNTNIESAYLKNYLQSQGYADPLIDKAIQELLRASEQSQLSLYELNKQVYELLRYGVKVKNEAHDLFKTVQFINWEQPLQNHFAIAEEVSITGNNTKRPDLVLYVNGIALGVIELKRSTVSVAEGIRQNIGNQKEVFIESFFSTIQLTMAGNDTEGLRYGTIRTPEKFYLTWKEPSTTTDLLDSHILQLCQKERLLELIHDFIVFDAGIKKLCRPHQYFGIKAAQQYIRAKKGGIIWHTQGSGKSLTMVWLAKWILENIPNSRVAVITDRRELQTQIRTTFNNTSEQMYEAKSCADILMQLNNASPRLLCSLVQKLGEKSESQIDKYVEDLKNPSLLNFEAKGDIYVFVDECHRTQSGELHNGMRGYLPNAVFIGFTGTPLLQANKKKSVETFGDFIHCYKFDEAVSDGVVLDLRYEARNVDQYIKSPTKIDQWFKARTKGLTSTAQAELKARWGTLQKVLSSKARLEAIAADIILDFQVRDRLNNGKGNAILVASSIYEAYKYYNIFQNAGFTKCAVISSYDPRSSDIAGEDSGEGATEKLDQYNTCKAMLNGKTHEEFEKYVKDKFVNEPGEMQVLIVVDMLLTGYDAPPATCLYLDKKMQDHGLFQAICRVNRLDSSDKEYGYIVDYNNLFQQLESSIQDYTTGPLAGYDPKDVQGLLSDRLELAAENLETCLETLRALCEGVAAPKGTAEFVKYFCYDNPANIDQLKTNEPKRLALYKATSKLIRAYAAIANELDEVGYCEIEIDQLKKEVSYFETIRVEIKLVSGDYIDLKLYEPAMRHLIDTYIGATDSEQISKFQDLSLVDMIVKNGTAAIHNLPKSISQNRKLMAETIENNIRKVIVDERPVNPKYFDEMSDLLESIIKDRHTQHTAYQQYLEKITELCKNVTAPQSSSRYPATMCTPGLQALYDNLDNNEALSLEIANSIHNKKKDSWRANARKERELKVEIQKVLNDKTKSDAIFDIVFQHKEF